MSEPRHSPPPSAHAPKPKGILKNPLDRRPSQAEGDALSGGAAPVAYDRATSDAGATGPHGTLSNGGLSWDEQNIALHDFEKENTQRMKIDEPKTPFVRGAGMDEDGFDGKSLGTICDIAVTHFI
jgi:protein phosphatase inhibitor 2